MFQSSSRPVKTTQCLLYCTVLKYFLSVYRYLVVSFVLHNTCFVCFQSINQSVNQSISLFCIEPILQQRWSHYTFQIEQVQTILQHFPHEQVFGNSCKKKKMHFNMQKLWAEADTMVGGLSFMFSCCFPGEPNSAGNNVTGYFNI